VWHHGYPARNGHASGHYTSHHSSRSGIGTSGHHQQQSSTEAHQGKDLFNALVPVRAMFGTVSMHSESEVSLALIQLQHGMYAEIAHRELLTLRRAVRSDFPPGHPTRTNVERLTKRSQRDRREAAV
jgi:hypothetical protein